MKNSIIAKIKENRTIANTAISDKIPHASKAILEGRKRNANDLLKSLYGEHLEFVRKNCILMTLCGEISEQVAELGRTKFNCFKFDIDGFFLDLTKDIPTSHYMNNGIGSGAFDFLMAKLEDLANEAGISAYSFIVYKASYNKVISSKEELAEVFKEAFMEQIGGEFLAAIATSRAAKIAFDKEQDRLKYPILLYTKDFNSVVQLSNDFKRMFDKSFLLSCDKEKLVEEADTRITRVNKMDLKNTFDRIKKLYS